MVDRQHREKAAFGGGGIATDAISARQRRERLRQLALETFDVSKDPYIRKNHLGTFECKLCGTVHTTEGSYMAHSQGKRHQNSLAVRAERDARLRSRLPPSSSALPPPATTTTTKKKTVVKIGRPGYRVVKFHDVETNQKGLQFTIMYPDIEQDLQPRHAFMSAYEQRVEPQDARFQYLLFAAAPYETIAMKIPNLPIDKGPDRFSTNWNKETKTFTLKLLFKNSAKA